MLQLENIEYQGYENEKLTQLFKDLGFQSLLDKIGGDESSVIDVEDFDEIDFEMVEEVTEAMFSEQNAFYVEVLDGNYHYADIIGFSLVNEKGHYYIPTETALGSNYF